MNFETKNILDILERNGEDILKQIFASFSCGVNPEIESLRIYSVAREGIAKSGIPDKA